MHYVCSWKEKVGRMFHTVLGGSPELSYKEQEGILYNRVVGKLKEYENSHSFLFVFFFSSGMVVEN